MKKKIRKPESMAFGTKGHKSVMPTHYAAESSGVKKNTLRPEKASKAKPKSLSKRSVKKK